MNVRKSSTVNFRFWFERQVRNARKPKGSFGAAEGRLYFEKLLGKTKSEGRHEIKQPSGAHRTLSVIYLSPIRSWGGSTMFSSMNDAIIVTLYL